MGKYGFDEAASTLENAGFTCTVTNDASIRTPGPVPGISEDLILINSGTGIFFDLGSSRGTNDVPILTSQPCR